MAVKWLYDEGRHRFLNANTGKPLTQKQMVTIRDSFVEARQEMVRGIVEQFSAGTLTQAELASSLNAATAETMTALSVIGAGGAERVEQMGPTFRDILEEQLNRQVPFMRDFMQEVQAGSVSGDEAANRATMYQSAAIQAYEQASAAEAGVADDLPYFPADWDTACKCVASPESRVWTERGMVAIADVRMGDQVMTHMGRFRPVTAVMRTKAIDRPYTDLAVHGGNAVRFTSDHRLFTASGWVDISRIMCENMSVLTARTHTDGKDEQMRGLWSAVRSPRAAVYAMREQDQSTQPMGRSRYSGKDDGFNPGSNGAEAAAIRGHHPRWGQVDSQAGRTAVHLVLGRGSEADDLPVSVGVDSGEWTDTPARPDSSQERGQVRRPVRKLGMSDTYRTYEASHERHESSPQISRSARGQDDREPDPNVRDMRQGVPHYGREETGTVLFESMLRGLDDHSSTGAHLPEMWQDVSCAIASWEVPEVLQSGVLPTWSETTLYDLTVEDDHSFIVEGIISHNSGCRCAWLLETVYEGADEVTYATWQTEEDDSVCEDCQARADAWPRTEIGRTVGAAPMAGVS